MLETLRMIQQQSNLTGEQFDDLCQVVLHRATGTEYRHRDVIEVPPVPTNMSAWVTTAELARHLGISLDLCAKWNKRGKLPAPDERINGRAVWSRKRVKQFCSDLVELNH